MNKKENQVGFSLRRIETKQFTIIESSFDKEKSTNLEVNLRFGSNSENRLISVYLLVNFIQNDVAFLTIGVVCYFEIEDDAWSTFSNANKSKLTIPKGFISHLVMLTVGTVRGVLHGKTENTFFNKILLPTLDVNQFVKEDLILETTQPV